jgi:hypothetical protein
VVKDKRVVVGKRAKIWRINSFGRSRKVIVAIVHRRNRNTIQLIGN